MLDYSKFKNIAIIQLGKVENILFTIPTIKGIKNKNKRAKITIIIANNFISKTKEIIGVNKVIPVNISNNTSTAKILQSTGIGKKNSYDLIINLTFNKISALISSKMNAKKRLGAFIDADNEYSLVDTWSQYFEAIVNTSSLNPFHFVDIYKYIAAVADEDTSMKLYPFKEISSPITELFKDEKSIKIGYQLNSQWPIKEITKLIKETLNFDENIVFFLFGNSDDVELGIKIKNKLHSKDLSNRCFDLSGKIKKNDFVITSKKMHIMIGQESTITHLAAANNAFTVTFSPFHQRIYQSSSYGHGHIIIASRYNSDGYYSIEWKIIYLIIIFFLKRPTPAISLKEWKNFLQKKSYNNIKILLSQRTIFQSYNSRRIDLIYEPLVGDDFYLQELFILIYRLLWQYFLNNAEDKIPFTLFKKKNILKKLNTLLNSIERLYKLALQGSNCCQNIESLRQQKNMDALSKESQTFQRIDDEIYAISKESDILRPICNFYKVNQFYNKGTGLKQQIIYSKNAYELIEFQILLIIDLIKSLISTEKINLLQKEQIERLIK